MCRLVWRAVAGGKGKSGERARLAKRSLNCQVNLVDLGAETTEKFSIWSYHLIADNEPIRLKYKFSWPVRVSV